MIRRLISAALLASAAATLATVSTTAAAQVSVDVRLAPPPPRYEVVPAPRPGYLWTPGYWDWRGRRHVWVGGNWVRERPGYYYAQPTWVESGNGWHLYRGSWARPDRDRDGVPNRYDRRPGNPYRR